MFTGVVPRTVVIRALAACLMCLAVAACGREIELPQIDEGGATAMHAQSISVEVDASGKILLEGVPVEADRLAEALEAKYGDLSKRHIYLRMHAEAKYGDAMAVMEALQRTGAKLSLVTDAAQRE